MKRIWKKCPLCGAKTVTLRRSDISVRIRGVDIVVPQVKFHECENCREQFFDYDASKQIDSVVFAGSRTKIAAM